jgi:hypothetical protein
MAGGSADGSCRYTPIPHGAPGDADPEDVFRVDAENDVDTIYDKTTGVSR